MIYQKFLNFQKKISSQHDHQKRKRQAKIRKFKKNCIKNVFLFDLFLIKIFFNNTKSKIYIKKIPWKKNFENIFNKKNFQEKT